MLKQYKQIEWKRPQDFMKGDVLVFDDGITPNCSLCFEQKKVSRSSTGHAIELAIVAPEVSASRIYQ